jgi:nucleoside-diphosphate-sugar epimerase
LRDEHAAEPFREKVSRTAVVTGATGFIGSHLVRFLLAKEWQVVGTYRAPESNLSPKSSGLRLVECDLRDGQSVKKLFQGNDFSHVFHLAAQSLPTLSWKDPVSTFESNILGSLHLFEAIRQVKRPPVVISACSGAEYGHVRLSDVPVTEEHPLRPLHAYGISKMCLDLLAQQYSRDYGIPTVNLRLFNTTGPGKSGDAPSDFVRQLVRVRKGLQPAVIEIGNPKPRRAFLDVDDAVQGFYLAATKGKHGEVYNLCAAKTYEIGQLLRMSMRLSGVKVEVKSSGHLLRPSDEKIIFGSTRKFRRDTGWKPRRTIEQTLGAMFEYWEQITQGAGRARLSCGTSEGSHQ